jgi:hypothetical protein
MIAASAHLPYQQETHRRLAAETGSRCDLVDVLLGIRREMYFRFEADNADAALLFAEVRQLLSLQAQALRMRSSDGIHEIRVGRFPGERLS